MSDEISLKLLQLLERDGGTTVKELAAAVGLAISSTHDRLKALRANGSLRGVHADIDPKVFGVQIEAILMVELFKQNRDSVDGFLDELAGLECVRTAFHVTGRHDLIVHLRAADVQHLKAIELDHFTSHPAVARVETSIIFDGRARFETPVYRSLPRNPRRRQPS